MSSSASITVARNSESDDAGDDSGACGEQQRGGVAPGPVVEPTGKPGGDQAADTSEQSSALKCDNGIDDDTDGLIDYPNDPYCTSSTTASEAPPVPLLNGLSTLVVSLSLAATGLRKTLG